MWRDPTVKWADPIFNTSEIACGMCKTFLAVFAVPILSSTSFSSLLLALGGMLAHNSNNDLLKLKKITIREFSELRNASVGYIQTAVSQKVIGIFR